MPKCLRVVATLLPYLAGGFAAPWIFKHVGSPQVAGHIAGTLFVFAAIWALAVSTRNGSPFWVLLFFTVDLALQVFFWGWRFFNSTPLREATLVGLSGGTWHGLLTGLYLIGAVVLLVLSWLNS